MRSKAHRKYIVTGAAGFIGSRFVESCCKSKNIELISVDFKDFFTFREEHKGVDFGTIVDPTDFFNWINTLSEKEPIDGICHLGAISDTYESNQSYLWKWNVEFTQQLWNFACKRQVPLIYASSGATYGDGSFGYDDDEKRLSLLKPLNLYGSSKHTFDLWALDQESIGHAPPVWAGMKFFNVYGWGEGHKKHAASKIFHAFQEIKKTGRITLFRSHRNDIRNGEQKRDFIFIDDVVNALHYLLRRDRLRGIYNLGTGEARSFLDLSSSVFSSMGFAPKVEFVDTPIEIRNSYQYYTQAKMSKFQSLGSDLSFTKLEEGVSKYIAKLNS